MTDLEKALNSLLEEEGGYSNHPADRGGKTNYGVTQTTYDAYNDAKKRPRRSITGISKAEVYDLYETLYWNAASCDKLPWPVSYVTFDAAVNSGVLRAVKWTQGGLGVPQDGKVGPATIQAAKTAVGSKDYEKLLGIVLQRSDFLSELVRSSPNQSVFLKGWWRRTLRVLERTLTS